MDKCLRIMYTVGMSNIQYTIRNVPPDLDKSLRLRSKKHQQSFNTTLIKALQLSTDISLGTAKDLDWFYGSGGIGQTELDSFKQQRVIDKPAWSAK